MNASSHRSRKTTEKNASLPMACAYGLLFAFGAGIVLLFLATAITYAQADPGRMAMPISLCALYLSAVVCGAVAAHKSETPMLAGGLAGGGYLGLILLISFLPRGDIRCGFTVWATVLVHLAIPAAAMLGAFVGKRRTKRSTARRGRHHRR